jgi:hypothetical protein
MKIDQIDYPDNQLKLDFLLLVNLFIEAPHL